MSGPVAPSLAGGGSGAAAASIAEQMHGEERQRMPLLDSRADWLAGLVRGSLGAVAHIGCTDSPYTAEQLARGDLVHGRLVAAAPGRVVGIDVDREGIELLRAAFPGERVAGFDLSFAVPAEERGRYGLVVAGEVLEHVPDADRFLRGCAALMAPGGRLCVTVPNACCPKIGLRALLGRESVHPDHRVYYGPRTLARTLRGAGLEVEWMATCFPPVAGRGGRLVVNPLLRAIHRVAQGPVGDGLIALARARSNASAIASGV